MGAAAQGTRFLLQVVPLFALGVFLAQLIIELGWLRAVSSLARPFMRLGRLRSECGASFMVSVVSPTAGHSMLADYRLEGWLGRLELVVAAVVNNLPGEIAAGRSVLPLALPALGVFGGVYYGLLLCAAAVKACLMLVVGRLLLPARDSAEPPAAAGAPRPLFRAALLNALRSSGRIVPRVLLTMVPTAYAAAALISWGVFDRLGAGLGLLARYFPVSGATLPIVAARLVSPVGAYTVAGSLLSAQAAGGREIVFALVTGALLSTGTNLRYLIPYYCGIFGPRTGAEVIGASILARFVSFCAVLAGMSFFWR